MGTQLCVKFFNIGIHQQYFRFCYKRFGYGEAEKLIAGEKTRIETFNIGGKTDQFQNSINAVFTLYGGVVAVHPERLLQNKVNFFVRIYGTGVICRQHTYEVYPVSTAEVTEWFAMYHNFTGMLNVWICQQL